MKKYITKEVRKSFNLTDKDIWNIRALKGKEGALFEHYNEEMLSKECGFYDRLVEWFKKECKEVNFCYWDDIPVMEIDIEKKLLTFKGKRISIGGNIIWNKHYLNVIKVIIF